MAIDGYEAALQDCFFLERYAGRVGTTIHAHMARTQFQEQLQLMGEFARLFRHDVGNNLLGSELFADSIRSTCQKLPSNKDTHRIHQLADMIYTELQTTKKLVALVGMMDITPEQAQRHATEQYVCDAFRSCLAHDIATVWQSRQYDVIFSVPKGTLDCRMRMNETYLTTIVENVIGNALKYTPLGGTIFMYLEHDKKGLHFNLVNTVDRALLPEDLQQVTQRGFRTGSASRSPTVGLDQGLGLYMIDRLIRDGYGGKLEPHSAATYDLTPFLDPGTHEVTYMGVDRPRGHISPYYSLGMFLPGETIHLDG
ncbi:MAG: sensor histidine kinase [Nanoarchaeota archaeon]